MPEDQERKIIVCPQCGGTVVRVHQYTYNHQDFDQVEEDWTASEYAECDDLVFRVNCVGCEADLTKHFLEAGWRLHDEDRMVEQLQKKEAK